MGIDFTQIAKDRKVYIWGAWNVGYALQKKLEEAGIEVAAYLDGKAAGGTFREKQVLGTDCLKELASDPSVFVFVACAEHPAIRRALADAGFAEGMNMLYMGVSFEVSTTSFRYADAYGNEVTMQSWLPSFSVGMFGRISVGKDVQIGDHVALIAWGGAELVIGDHVKIGDHCVIEARDLSTVRIGDRCTIDENTSVCCKRAGTIQIGQKCTITGDSELFCENARIRIGDRVMFNRGFHARFLHQSSFICGENSTFGYQVKMRGENGHTIIDLEKQSIHPNRKDVVISDHVWVGMGATLLGGTVIGRDSIVGADSLVTKEFPANSLIAGSPAKVIKENVTWDMRPDITYEEWTNYH